MAAVIIHSDFGAQENEICNCFHFFPIYLPWSDGTRCPDPNLLILRFKPAILLSFFTFKRLFSSFSLLPLMWYHLHIWGCWYFFLKSWFQLVLHPAWHFSWCTLHISYINKVTMYSLDVFLSLIGTSLLFHVQVLLLLLDLHTGFSGVR